ncbi:MAG: acetamidase/formamidase family protein, partial [Nitratireductor sp.]
MPKTVFSVDLNKAPEDQAIKTHNRWHPDIPMVETFKRGEVFRVE